MKLNKEVLILETQLYYLSSFHSSIYTIFIIFLTTLLTIFQICSQVRSFPQSPYTRIVVKHYNWQWTSLHKFILVCNVFLLVKCPLSHTLSHFLSLLNRITFNFEFETMFLVLVRCIAVSTSDYTCLCVPVYWHPLDSGIYGHFLDTTRCNFDQDRATA